NENNGNDNIKFIVLILYIDLTLISSKLNCSFLNLKYSSILHLFKYTFRIASESLLSLGIMLVINIIGSLIYCPLRSKYTNSKNYTKQVTRYAWPEYLEEAKHLRHTALNKEIYEKRKNYGQDICRL